MAAMAAQIILTASPSFHPLLSTHSSSFNTSFHRISLNLPRQSLASTPKKPLSVVATSNEAFSGLNCTSDDDSLVNFVQDYDGVAEATIVDSQILLSDDDESDDGFGPVAAVPKKRTSRMKKRIRKNVWKRKGAVAAKKAYSLAKSIYTGKSTSFMTDILKKDP